MEGCSCCGPSRETLTLVPNRFPTQAITSKLPKRQLYLFCTEEGLGVGSCRGQLGAGLTYPRFDVRLLHGIVALVHNDQVPLQDNIVVFRAAKDHPGYLSAGKKSESVPEDEELRSWTRCGGFPD